MLLEFIRESGVQRELQPIQQKESEHSTEAGASVQVYKLLLSCSLTESQLQLVFSSHRGLV